MIVVIRLVLSFIIGIALSWVVYFASGQSVDYQAYGWIVIIGTVVAYPIVQNATKGMGVCAVCRRKVPLGGAQTSQNVSKMLKMVAALQQRGVEPSFVREGRAYADALHGFAHHRNYQEAGISPEKHKATFAEAALWMRAANQIVAEA